MSVITIASIIISLCALFSYVNFRFFKLPPTIGVMVIALLLSLVILGLPLIGLDVKEDIQKFIQQINFSETLLHGMLSFLLFAGALHVKIEDLGRLKWIISILACFGTIFSTILVAGAIYYLLPLLGGKISWLYALIFGALISPTDPVAVMAILKKVGVSKSLETKVVGESLFNDGIAVVIFLVLLNILQGGSASVPGIFTMFIQEAVGGALLGAILGYIAYRMLSSIDNYQVEILLTLALVMGGYELSHYLHVSGPIAMVVSGLLIGNHGRKFAMSKNTRVNLDNFWELVDEFLNAVLFLLIGAEILMLTLGHTAFKAGLILIPILLIIRLISVSIPIHLLRYKMDFSPNVIQVLTWGGLRGGISVALVLSLPAGSERALLLVVTYMIVLFSILVQGLTISKLVAKAE